MKLTFASPSVARRRIAKGLAACALGAGMFYTASFGKDLAHNYRETQRRVASLEAPIIRLIESDEYIRAWDEMKKLGIPAGYKKAFMEKNDSRIHDRKIGRIQKEIDGGNYAGAKKLFDSFSSTIPQDKAKELELKIIGINPQSIFAEADKHFYSRLSHNENKRLHYDIALEIISRSKDPSAGTRIAEYRLTMLDDCFHGCVIPKYVDSNGHDLDYEKRSSIDFILSEISNLEKYHAGIRDEYAKERFIRGAVGYVGSSEKGHKDAAVDAILDKGPAIFAMHRDERNEFTREVFGAYLKFFEYISADPSADKSYNYSILQHVLGKGRQYGIDLSAETARIIEKYSR